MGSDYPYIYETHLHTSQGSACARSTGAEMARACREAGYTGIMVTDHFFYGNTRADRALPWRDWVEEFCSGYEDAKAEGDRIGLQVFFGWEANYQGTEFLIYGPDKGWLMEHPEIRDISVEEQYALVSAAGGLIVHCHPFRKEPYIPQVRLFPKWTDAVEGVNASHASKRSKAHNNPEFDVKAQEYAAKYGLPMTAGSDVHTTNLLLGGMAFQRKLENVADYVRLMKSLRGVPLAQCPFRLLDGNEPIAAGNTEMAVS